MYLMKMLKILGDVLVLLKKIIILVFHPTLRNSTRNMMFNYRSFILCIHINLQANTASVDSRMENISQMFVVEVRLSANSLRNPRVYT